MITIFAAVVLVSIAIGTSAESNAISIDSIAFRYPPSGTCRFVYPGQTYPVKVQVFDDNGDIVMQPTAIRVESTNPEFGDIEEKVRETDSTGQAVFRAYITNGNASDTFPIVATLVSDETIKDHACMVVGEERDRLWIFYGDTLSYNSSAEIVGCSGERVPVTIRASKDGNIISTGRTTEFTIQLTTGLAVYASETSAEPITESQLANGEVTLWLQAIVKNVSSGEITVMSKDPAVVNGTRGNINFSACFNQITMAVYYADNGVGSVDRVIIGYDQALNASKVPDSLNLFWPSTQHQSRMVRKENILLNPDDLTMLIVTLPEPFPAEITRYTGGSGANLGISYWENPNTPDAGTNIVQFNIEDGVGPLLVSAILVERLSAGNDSIIVTFTETVDFSNVIGTSLTLLKNGTPIPLTVLNAQPSATGNGQIVAVIGDLGDNRPVAGDSLMITAAGPIVDASGNKAHDPNRPVMITIKSIAPDINGAVYLDLNADGIVEIVRISFNKVIDPQRMLVKLTFDGINAFGFVDTANITFVEGSGGLMVDVKTDGLFSPIDILDKTSGAMSVEAVFMDYLENNKSTASAIDGAAPVLNTVRYHFGRMTGAGLAPDTVYAKYSEELRKPPVVDRPIHFLASSGELYEVIVSYNKTGSKEEYFFNVEAITPEVGLSDTLTFDSAWINTALNIEDNAVDKMNNAQGNPSNKRVAVQTVGNRESNQDSEPSEREKRDEEEREERRRCGFGSNAAFIPPLFYYTRRRLRLRKK